MTTLALLALAPFLAAGSALGQARPEVGNSVEIKGEVTKEAEAQKRKFAKGDQLLENETLETGKTGTAELQLVDDAKIAVGPESKITIEAAGGGVTDPQGGLNVTLAKGSLRVVTPKEDKRTYRITTPTATVTARAAVFDVFVARNGEVAVLVHEGSVEICPTPASCRRHNTLGRFVHVTTAGVLSDPVKWDGRFLKGVAIATAFPFVGRSLKIDPIRRLRHAELLGKLPIDPTGELKNPVDVLNKAPRSFERSIPIPRPRLPF